MIVKIDHCEVSQSSFLESYRLYSELTVDGEPLIFIFTFWKFHNFAQAATAQCRLSILSQLIACCALCGITWPELIACSLVTMCI